MPVCKKCNTKFPNKIQIEGKWKYLKGRSFCLECSTWGKDSLPDGKRLSSKNKTAGICITCGKEKMLHGRNLECPACRTKKQRNQNKQNILLELNLSCFVCGYNKSIYGIDFHHLDPNEKENEICSMWHMSKEKILKEIKKCVILCTCCHRELHAGVFELLIKKDS